MFQQLTAPVAWVLGAIFAMLVLSSITVHTLELLRKERDYTEVSLRVSTWWVMIVVFAIAISVHPKATVGLFGLISFLALKEYLSLVPTRRADRRVLLWAYLSIPVQYYWIGSDWYTMFLIWVPVYVFLGLPTIMVLVGETKGYLTAAGRLFWGVMTTVFSLGHAAYLVMLPGTPGEGAGLLLYLVLLTQLNDVAQFIWGKTVGRRKVIPRVSPGKTVGGLLGGVLTTTVLGVLLAPLLTPLPPHHALFAGLIIGLGGFVGDVTVSAVKRDLGIKDFGALLPGHGGILDRVDSLTYTAPLFFHFVRYLHY
ncbi:MAG: phosphatidate cytidylyltransferase [Gammaproteobacteria bacterium]